LAYLPTAIDLHELDRLLADGAQLVAAWPEEEYDGGHRPGAVSLPLKQLTAERSAILERGRPVVVYCWDSL
jgi:rhodanese-related sulfurtransferase